MVVHNEDLEPERMRALLLALTAALPALLPFLYSTLDTHFRAAVAVRAACCDLHSALSHSLSDLSRLARLFQLTPLASPPPTPFFLPSASSIHSPFPQVVGCWCCE